MGQPNPLLRGHQLNVRMMSAAWCRANGSDKVPNFTQKEEAASTRRAMGTGPCVIERWEPGTRLVLLSGRHRLHARHAAAGREPPVGRPRRAPAHRPENRVLFFGLDQARDELPNAGAKGRNTGRTHDRRRANATTPAPT